MECRELQFKAMTFQERLSRLEQLVECLLKAFYRLDAQSGANSNLLRDLATEFRGCDGEPLIKSKAGEYRVLHDQFFSLREGDLHLQVFDQNAVRSGGFGIDLTGQFYAFKHSSSGEELVLLASPTGLYCRDQNGQLGKLIIRPDGLIEFQTV